MVNEVEDILNEIRERVRADHEPGAAPCSLAVQVETVKDSLLEPKVKSESGNHESLGRLSAHLTTTARAWDRLPPMFSNRKGGAARVEMWIKARLKSMSRWFTWEQVNFNSAVHHALSETLNALLAYERELARMRAELARNAAIEARAAEMAAGVATEIDAARGEIDEARTEIDEARTEITSRLAELAGELRESDEQLREEQRVCFKQLSLEASEAMVMGDRGRRVIESRLDKLEKAASDGEG